MGPLSGTSPRAVPVGEMVSTFAAGLLCLILAGCIQSYGVPSDAECRTDADCLEGTRCTVGGTCICSAASCAGCCSADGRVCHLEQEDQACGRGGDICQDCTTTGEICTPEGVCIEPTCTSECDVEGDSECVSETSWHECRINTEGCLSWTEEIDCPAGEICRDGRCQGECRDECMIGEPPRCDGSTILECGEGDTDPCLEWVERGTCAPGELCHDGVCIPGCPDPCEREGEIDCSGNTIIECQYLPEMGCYNWVELRDCPDNMNCQNGSCVFDCDCPIETTRGCLGGDVVECSWVGEGCLHFDGIRSCPEGTHCVDGVCMSCGECAPGDQVCVDRRSYQSCSSVEDGCPTWSDVLDCDSGVFCSDGVCRYRLSSVAGGPFELQRADGTFLCPPDFRTESRPDAATMGDIDSDGDLEIIALFSRGTSDGASRIEICELDCRCHTSYDIDLMYTFYAIEIADIFEDGPMDVIVAGSFQDPDDTTREGAAAASYRVLSDVSSLEFNIAVEFVGERTFHWIEVDEDLIRVSATASGHITDGYCLNYDFTIATCP